MVKQPLKVAGILWVYGLHISVAEGDPCGGGGKGRGGEGEGREIHLGHIRMF